MLFISDLKELEAIPTKEASIYMAKADTECATWNNRSICAPFSQEIYIANV